MTRTEIDKWLSIYSAHWPRPEMTPEKVVLWQKDLADKDAEVSFAVLEALRETDEFHPSLARFLTTYRQVVSREPKRALPEPRRPDQAEINRRGMAMTRKALAEGRARRRARRGHIDVSDLGLKTVGADAAKPVEPF